jgi:hypothetical protein
MVLDLMLSLLRRSLPCLLCLGLACARPSSSDSSSPQSREQEQSDEEFERDEHGLVVQLHPAKVPVKTFEQHPLHGTRMAELCESLVTEANAATKAEQFDQALTQLQEAAATCGGGYGIHWRMGWILQERDEFDAAALAYGREIVTQYPLLGAFAALLQLLPMLSPETRATVARIGDSQDGALYVPSIEHEYGWVALFACPDGQGEVGMQALIELDDGRRFDRLTFTCPDGSERHVYFHLTHREVLEQLLGG